MNKLKFLLILVMSAFVASCEIEWTIDGTVECENITDVECCVLLHYPNAVNTSEDVSCNVPAKTTLIVGNYTTKIPYGPGMEAFDVTITDIFTGKSISLTNYGTPQECNLYMRFVTDSAVSHDHKHHYQKNLS